MNIQWRGDEDFQIKTKGMNIRIGKTNTLGDYEIQSPGEYEVGGSQIEVIDGIIEVFVEGMTIGHLKKGKVMTDDELEKLGNIDILLIGVGGGEFTDSKIANDVIAQIDPAVVIPMGKNIDEFAKKESTESKEELKISKNELPSEDRQMVVLNAASAK